MDWNWQHLTSTTAILAPWPGPWQINQQTLTSNRLEPAQTWQIRDGLKLTSDTNNYLHLTNDFLWPQQANQQFLASNKTSTNLTYNGWTETDNIWHQQLLAPYKWIDLFMTWTNLKN